MTATKITHEITVTDTAKPEFFDWACTCGLELKSIDLEDVEDCTRTHLLKANFVPEKIEHEITYGEPFFPRGMGRQPFSTVIRCSCGWTRMDSWDHRESIADYHVETAPQYTDVYSVFAK